MFFGILLPEKCSSPEKKNLLCVAECYGQVVFTQLDVYDYFKFLRQYTQKECFVLVQFKVYFMSERLINLVDEYELTLTWLTWLIRRVSPKTFENQPG